MFRSMGVHLLEPGAKLSDVAGPGKAIGIWFHDPNTIQFHNMTRNEMLSELLRLTAAIPPSLACWRIVKVSQPGQQSVSGGIETGMREGVPPAAPPSEAAMRQESESDALENAVYELVATTPEAERQAAIYSMVRRNPANMQMPHRARLLLALQFWRNKGQGRCELERIDACIATVKEL